LRLVPKNLRNYLQTPTLIGCRFLTNFEATLRLLRLALLRSAKPCSLSRFFKYRQTFFAFNIFLFAPRNLRCKTLKLFQRSLRLCTVFCNPVNFEGSFYRPIHQQPPLPGQPPNNTSLRHQPSPRVYIAFSCRRHLQDMSYAISVARTSGSA
jgi:hypothetical protein